MLAPEHDRIFRSDDRRAGDGRGGRLPAPALSPFRHSIRRLLSSRSEIAVIHRVADPQAFMKAEDEAVAAGLPAGFSLPVHAATHDHGVGVRIWEGSSVESVRDLVEAVVGPYSENGYIDMSVDGLPSGRKRDAGGGT